MSDPAKVRVRGPLAPLIPGFRGRLAALGYSPGAAAQQLQMLAHLSRWMLARDQVVHDLSPESIEEFFRSRRRSHTNLTTARSMDRFLDFLDELGLDRSAGTAVPVPEWEAVSGRFCRYLALECALAPTTVESYLNQVRPFLRWRAGRTTSGLGSLSVNEVTGFLLIRGSAESAGSVRVAVSALRALMKWLYLSGTIEEPLAEGIGPVSYSAFGAMPKALPPGQVSDLVSHAADSRVSPCRDRAIVVLLSRLGLRSREAAGLRLEDLNWRAGTVVVHGKGGTTEAMPLPADAGAAIAGYLKHERPAMPDRHLFLQSKAPHAPLGRSGISAVVSRMGQRAGMASPVGAHRLRHSAATSVLAAGGTLTEASQLMRHASSASTVIYARVDLAALRPLARPWPGAERGIPGSVTGPGRFQ
jgi:integrase/recombinase XerD